MDVALVEQEFIDKAKRPIIWVDHHGPYERRNVKYFNPRIENKEDNLPTTYLCYKVVKKDGKAIAYGPNDKNYEPHIKTGEVLSIESRKPTIAKPPIRKSRAELITDILETNGTITATEANAIRGT